MTVVLEAVSVTSRVADVSAMGISTAQEAFMPRIASLQIISAVADGLGL
jgi:hypothetical protein